MNQLTNGNASVYHIQILIEQTMSSKIRLIKKYFIQFDEIKKRLIKTNDHVETWKLSTGSLLDNRFLR